MSLRTEELPVETATSLVIENAACVDRDPLIRAVLREIETHYRDWSEAHGDADACGLRAAYLAISATVGREVRVELPGAGAHRAGHRHRPLRSPAGRVQGGRAHAERG